MKNLLNKWFALGFNIIGIGVSIVVLPFTLVMGFIIMIIKLFR